MGYGEFERCPLLRVMLSERKERVGCSDYWSGDGVWWIDEGHTHSWVNNIRGGH